MPRYIVTGGYKTWHGNIGTFRRVVDADSHESALNTVCDRVRTWKRYMGGLEASACLAEQENEDG